jgi:hypothetical protein
MIYNMNIIHVPDKLNKFWSRTVPACEHTVLMSDEVIYILTKNSKFHIFPNTSGLN